jgi:hypothetical protein
MLLLTDSSAPTATEALPTFTPPQAAEPTGPAFDLMNALGRFANTDDHAQPGAAIISISDPASDMAGVFEFASTTIADVVAALNAGAAAQQGGVR